MKVFLRSLITQLEGWKNKQKYLRILWVPGQKLKNSCSKWAEYKEIETFSHLTVKEQEEFRNHRTETPV